MKSITRVFVVVSCLLANFSYAGAQQGGIHFFGADHPYFQYTGRIDFSNPSRPRFWQPGVYITFRVKGNYCRVIVNDEVLWGKNHNYIELVVNGRPTRLQTKASTDTIWVKGLDKPVNTIVLCKNTEANIGYMEMVGILCKELVAPPARPGRKIEFIGNSITCGASADASQVPCGKGVWHDQHNAYLSYGPTTARSLHAQYHLSSVSGIGLMHSCCNMNIIMPQVYDKVSMRDDTISWDFARYQPDVVTVCLGQNDGVQDSAAFCDNYISFLRRLRTYYPKASIICLSSPMADANLAAFMKKTLAAVVGIMNREGDKRIAYFLFSKQYNHGCDWHPNVEEHQAIARELIPFMKKTMNW
jgi:hypothetical protein